jgi:hypothetical protein
MEMSRKKIILLTGLLALTPMGFADEYHPEISHDPDSTSSYESRSYDHREITQNDDDQWEWDSEDDRVHDIRSHRHRRSSQSDEAGATTPAIPVANSGGLQACQILNAQYDVLTSDQGDARFFYDLEPAQRDSLKKIVLCSHEASWRSCLNVCQNDKAGVGTLTLGYGLCVNMLNTCCAKDKQGNGYECRE